MAEARALAAAVSFGEMGAELRACAAMFVCHGLVAFEGTAKTAPEARATMDALATLRDPETPGRRPPRVQAQAQPQPQPQAGEGASAPASANPRSPAERNE